MIPGREKLSVSKNINSDQQQQQHQRQQHQQRHQRQQHQRHQRHQQHQRQQQHQLKNKCDPVFGLPFYFILYFSAETLIFFSGRNIPGDSVARRNKCVSSGIERRRPAAVRHKRVAQHLLAAS